MAASVLMACSLNEINLPKMVFLEEGNGADGSFLINCILHQRVKMQDTGIVLTCLHQTFDHYQAAGLRLGYNLTMFKERKTLKTIEPLVDLYENFFASKYATESPEELINHFIESLKTDIKELLNVKSKVLVIIDDLTFFVNLGVSENAIVRLCQTLQRLTEELPSLTIIFKTNTSDSYTYLCNNIDDIVEMKIKIEKLKSGNFKEVDGKITVIRRDTEQPQLLLFNTNGSNKPNKTVLYKVVDKAIKIFALGELGVKI